MTAQVVDGPGRRFLDRIGDAEQAGGPSVEHDEDDCLALASQGVGSAGQVTGARLQARPGTPSCRPRRHGRRPGPRTPSPVRDWNDSAAGMESPRSRAAPAIAAASGCSLACSRPAARRISSDSSWPGAAIERDDPRLSLRQRAGLVEDQGLDPLEGLQGLGVLHQHAGAGASAGPDHDRHRRRQSQGTRAGDDQDRDGVDQRMGQPGLGARRAPRRRT